MRHHALISALLAGICCATFSSPLRADATVDQKPLGPDGRLFGCSISSHGLHVASIAPKGSRYQIFIDGADGPVIESLMSDVGRVFQGNTTWIGQIPVVWSNDGSHCAFFAKQGDEFVLYQDGKEYCRGPLNPNAGTNQPLTFSPGGKHLFFMQTGNSNDYCIVVDAKPGPMMKYPGPLVISPNGEHYAYVGETPNPPNSQGWSFVDGKQVNYFGDNLQYNARGALLSQLSAGGATTFVINGKPEIKAASINPVWLSDDGTQIAMVITPTVNAPSFLSVDGKVIQGTQGINIEKLFFSPNGKRWAALCSSKSGSHFMIVDGKKMQDYGSISTTNIFNQNSNLWTYATGMQNGDPAMPSMERPIPGFTADSSKFVYVATVGAQSFLEVEDQESDGFQNLVPSMGMAGNRVAFYGVSPDGHQHVGVDGKDRDMGPINVPGQPGAVSNLTFSPDGNHYAFTTKAGFCLDGNMLPGAGATRYVFSADGKHIAYQAVMDDKSCWFIDGKVVATDFGMVNRAFFSPDGQHLFWVKTGMVEGSKDPMTLFLDGKPVTHFDMVINGAGLLSYSEFSSDDTLTFIARTDGNLRRFIVKPSADSGVTAMLAAAEAAEAKAKADAEAMKARGGRRG